MTKLTSFEADIRPLFTDRDIRAMSKAFNLGSYNDVKTHASAIYDRIRGIGGAVMPPPPPRGKVPGLNLGSTYSPSGWRKGTSLNRFAPRRRPQAATGCRRHVSGPLHGQAGTRMGRMTLLIPLPGRSSLRCGRCCTPARRISSFTPSAFRQDIWGARNFMESLADA